MKKHRVYWERFKRALRLKGREAADRFNEKQDAIYELVSTAQAFIQESIQWTNQNKRTSIFEMLPEHLVVWLNSHPSSGKVSSPSITTSIS